ncbi:MAG: hypothetical protein ACK44T_06130, partial [Sphingomonadales bacterium]
LAARYVEAEPKGEIVVIVGPPQEAQTEEGDFDAALALALETLPPAKAAKEVAKRFGLDRAEVYDRAMAIKAKNCATGASSPKSADAAENWWRRGVCACRAGGLSGKG